VYKAFWGPLEDCQIHTRLSLPREEAIGGNKTTIL
jgi:hypothetical protein